MPDSYSPLLIDVALEDVEGRPDITIPAHRYVRSLNINETANAAWNGSITLFDPEGDFIESILTRLPVGRRVVKFRWGWDAENSWGRAADLDNFPHYRGAIGKWTPAFTHLGTELNLELTASQALEAATDKFGWSVPEGMNPTEVFMQIAERRGWLVEDSLGFSTVEMAHRVVDKPLQVSNQDDIAFIKEVLLPLAVDSDGEPFRFFFSRDSVHFHGPNYRLNQGRGIVKDYVFARDTNGEVVSFAPDNAALFSQLGGGENARYTFVEDRTGDPVVIETTREGGPDSLIVLRPDEQALTDFGDGDKAVIPIPARTEAEGRLMVSNNYHARRLTAYNARLEVRGTHEVLPTDYINVEYFTRDGRKHYLSGVFSVLTIEHTVAPGSWQTSMSVYRAGQGEVEPNARERLANTSPTRWHQVGRSYQAAEGNRARQHQIRQEVRQARTPE